MVINQLYKQCITWKTSCNTWIVNYTFLSCTYLNIAFKSGGRNVWLWVTTILHGIAVEVYSYELKDIDNFWHHQGTVMLFKKRFPLYIVCLC